MKKNILVWLIYCLGPVFVMAQEPFYLLYNPSCMDVYEYRYAYTNQSVTNFSAHPNAYDQFIFSAGEGSIKARTLPAGTVNCSDLALDDSFVDAVNSLSRPMYIVQQDQSGYLMTPVVMATRIQRAGNGYALRSLNYNFFFDPQQSNSPSSNLAIAGSQSYVYYRGNQIRNCQNEYAFHRDPLAKGGETSDFEFIPGVGITSDKTGRNAQEAQSNHLLLHKINDRLLNDHIATKCGGNQSTVNQTGTVFVGPPVVENREDATTVPTTTTGTPVYTASGDCAQQSGPGYHVIQRGETLMSVSRRYNIPLRTLIATNNLSDPDHLHVCQVVQLGKQKAPAAKKPAGKKTTAKAAPRPKSYSEMVNSSSTPAMTYSTTSAATAYRPASQKHLVQPGESLASVARKYGYTEARLREMNNFTPDGLITLTPGTELIINDCNCNTTGAVPQPTYSSPTTYTTTTPTIAQPVVTQPQPTEPSWSGTPSSNKPTEQLYFETPVAGNNVPQTMTTAPQPANTVTTPVYTPPSGGNNTTPMVYNTTPQTTTTTPVQQRPETPQRKPEVSYLEHYVQQGETISSIAIRFKVSPQEVALVNGKEVSETLIAGQRLLVPRY